MIFQGADVGEAAARVSRWVAWLYNGAALVISAIVPGVSSSAGDYPAPPSPPGNSWAFLVFGAVTTIVSIVIPAVVAWRKDRRDTEIARAEIRAKRAEEAYYKSRQGVTNEA